MDMINEAYTESGKGWACLGLVSLEANTALVATQAKVDSFMSSLPSGDASAAEVKRMLAELEGMMEEKEIQADKQLEDAKTYLNDVKEAEVSTACALSPPVQKR